MGYRPDHIEVRRRGRFSYAAYIIRVDDGLPADECPVHGWDGPPRNSFGTMLVSGVTIFDSPRDDSLNGCCCPVSIGMDLEQEPYYGLTHRQAWKRARRHMRRSVK